MAVARGAQGLFANSSSLNPSFNLAINALDNYILVYVVGSGVSSHASFGVQSITVGGVAMTRRYTDPGGSGSTAVEAYELFNPTSGGSVAITATRAASGYAPITMFAKTYRGVQTGAKTFTRTTAISTSSSPETKTQNITSTSVDDITDSVCSCDSNHSALAATAASQTSDGSNTDADVRRNNTGYRAGAAGAVTHSYDKTANASSRAAWILGVNIDAAPTAATKLTVSAQPPASVVVGATFGVTVRAESPSGVLDPTFVSNVTIAIQTGTGTLAGTTTVAAVGGVATFTGLSMNTIQTGLVLRLSGGGLTVADCSAMDIVAGAAGGGGVFQSGIFD